MLSKTSGRLLVFAVKWTNFCCGMPYSWDDRRAKIKISRRAWKKWVCFQSYTLIIGTFNCMRLTLTFASLYSTSFDKLMRIISTFISLIPTIFAINTWKYHLELACFINSYIRFSQHFRNAYVKKLGRGYTNGCEPILRLLSLLALIFPLFPTLIYAKDPANSRFMTSVLKDRVTQSAFNASCIVYGIIQTLWLWSAASTVMFYVFSTFLPAYVLLGILPESMPDQHYYISKPVVRKPPRLCSTFRAYQLLTRMLNNAVSRFLFPMRVCSILFQVVCFCVLIRFWTRLTPLGRLVIGVMPNMQIASMLLATFLSGRWFQQTQACIHSWKSLRLKVYMDALYLKKFRISCHPLGLHVGSFYTNQLNQVLHTINSMFKLILKTLIYLNKTS